MRLRTWRILVMVALGTGLGLAWNAASGRGLVLGRNAFLKDGDALEEITPAEARQRLDRGALFLDARPQAFYDMSHIPGAQALPLDDFDRAFTGLEPTLRANFDIVIYCAGFGCDASHELARKLAERSIHAVILQGGWPDWTDAGYPVKKGPQP
jgi:rhodanese-related sulfurtransferase